MRFFLDQVCDKASAVEQEGRKLTSEVETVRLCAAGHRHNMARWVKGCKCEWNQGGQTGASKPAGHKQPERRGWTACVGRCCQNPGWIVRRPCKTCEQFFVLGTVVYLSKISLSQGLENITRMRIPEVAQVLDRAADNFVSLLEHLGVQTPVNYRMTWNVRVFVSPCSETRIEIVLRTTNRRLDAAITKQESVNEDCRAKCARRSWGSWGAGRQELQHSTSKGSTLSLFVGRGLALQRLSKVQQMQMWCSFSTA